MQTLRLSAWLLVSSLAAAASPPAHAGPPSAAPAVPASAAVTAKEAAIEVRGDLTQPGRLTPADLAALPRVTATWKIHEKTHTVVGVALEQVLRRFGWEPGVMSKTVPPTEKRAGYKRVVVDTAQDGFQAVFSAAELAQGMGPSQVLLVSTVDGKPLPPEQGPLRLVVPSDGEPSRSLYQIARIDLVDMRRIIPPTAK